MRYFNIRLIILYLRPFGSPPFRGTINHIALHPVRGRGLRTHVARHYGSVAFGHFVYAVDFAHLKPDAAAMGTWLKFADVPPGRTRLIVTRLGQHLGLVVARTQIRRDDLFILFSYAQHQRFLYACSTIILRLYIIYIYV